MERDANDQIILDDELQQELFNNLNNIGFSGHVANYLIEVIYRLDQMSRDTAPAEDES